MTREELYPGATWYKPGIRHTVVFQPQPDVLAQVNAVLPAYMARWMASEMAYYGHNINADTLARYADLLDALAAVPEPERSMAIAQEELDA